MVTLGTDPEVAYIKDGHIVPAEVVFNRSGLDVIAPPPPPKGLEQTKGSRIYLNETDSLYADGMSNELNLKPQVHATDLVSGVRNLLQFSLTIAKQQGLDIGILPTIPVTKEDIELGGVKCAVFGCDPDKTVWDDKFDPAKVDASLIMNRFFGAHIHAGMTDFMKRSGGIDWLIDNMYFVMMAFDFSVGLADVIMDHSEQARTRRQVYGRGGRHRIQIPYGLEYRTPSNSILCSPVVLRHMFNLAKFAMYLSHDFETIDTMLGRLESPQSLFRAIVDVDVKSATNIYRRVVSPVLSNLDEPELEPLKDSVQFVLDFGRIYPNGVYDLPDYKTNWEIE